MSKATTKKGLIGTTMTDSSDTECPYCGVDYTDPNGIASDGYMKIGHLIMDCEEIPQAHRAYINRESGHDEQPEGLFNNDE